LLAFAFVELTDKPYYMPSEITKAQHEEFGCYGEFSVLAMVTVLGLL